MKNRIIAATLALLWFPSFAWCKPKHWYTDPKFWIGEAVIAGALVADGATTVHGLNRGLVETNPLLGPHPSTSSVVSFGIPLFAGYTAANAASHYFTRNESKPWRIAGYVAIPAIVGVSSTVASVRNAELK